MWIDDVVIEKCTEKFFNNIFVPSEVNVVLGRGNKAHLEVEESVCEKEGVSILKRYGGGGTVVLHKGCLVVSTGAWVNSPFKNDLFFEKLNNAVARNIRGYSDLIPEIKQRGISDLAIGERKIAGTSMFRSKSYLLYQASILVDMDIDMISRYLKHPTKEPEYRKGKSHKDFLTDLAAFDKEITSMRLLYAFKENFERYLLEELGEYLVTPDESHVKHLFKRIERAD